MTLALDSSEAGGGDNGGGELAVDGGGDSVAADVFCLLPDDEGCSSFDFFPRPLGVSVVSGAGSGLSPTVAEAGGASGFSSGYGGGVFRMFS